MFLVLILMVMLDLSFEGVILLKGQRGQFCHFLILVLCRMGLQGVGAILFANMGLISVGSCGMIGIS